MRNRIGHLLTPTNLSEQADLGLEPQPQLTLHMERPFNVDMERFFEFTFSFAEALLDLEAKYAMDKKVATLERFLSEQEAAEALGDVGDEFECDIDARWM